MLNSRPFTPRLLAVLAVLVATAAILFLATG